MIRSLFELFAILILLCSCGNSGKLSADAEFFGLLAVHNNGENVEIVNGGAVVATIKDASILRLEKSVDGKKAMIMVNNGEARLFEPGFEGWSLYYYDDELIHIADDVRDALLSQNGDSVSYVSSPDYTLAHNGEKDFDEVLAKIFVWSGGENTFVIMTDIYTKMEFSPDGKDFFYEIISDEDGHRDWYKYTDKGSVLAVDNARLSAVSDNSEFLYILSDEDDTFYVQKGLCGERVKLAEYSEVNSFLFNADNRQVLVNTDSGHLISGYGSEPAFSYGQSQHLIIPRLKYFGEYSRGLVIDDFRGQYFLSEFDKIYKINNDFSITGVAEDVQEAYMSDDGETITYTTDFATKIATMNINDPTVKTSFTHKDISRLEYSTDRIDPFFVSYDGESVYYMTNFSKELYTLQNGKSKLIYDTDDNSLRIDSACLYDNNKLYYASGEDKKTLLCLEGDNVTVIKTFPDTILDLQTHYGALEVLIIGEDYYSFDGKNFTCYE
jgi:hypothetical protein